MLESLITLSNSQNNNKYISVAIKMSESILNYNNYYVNENENGWYIVIDQ